MQGFEGLLGIQMPELKMASIEPARNYCYIF